MLLTGALPIGLVICALALVVEAVVGYPPQLFHLVGHPVTWMGAVLNWLDHRLNCAADPPETRRRNGALALAGLVILFGVLAWLIQASIAGAFSLIASTFVIALTASCLLAQRSLDRHVRAVADALNSGPEAGRKTVAMIVGRDTYSLDEAGISRAAIESLGENFADGVVAPAFYLALLGLPGGVAYKAINTADSMIGHRTARHEAFGFAAARTDDVVNWPAARLAALWIVLAAAILPGASGREAWRIMRRDARGHPSPNAGWPEAAMAGALSIRLGGPRSYAGRTVVDRTIGDGDAPVDADTIRRALRLYRLACGLNILAVACAALVIARWR